MSCRSGWSSLGTALLGLPVPTKLSRPLSASVPAWIPPSCHRACGRRVQARPGIDPRPALGFFYRAAESFREGLGLHSSPAPNFVLTHVTQAAFQRSQRDLSSETSPQSLKIVKLVQPSQLYIFLTEYTCTVTLNFGAFYNSMSQKPV